MTDGVPAIGPGGCGTWSSFTVPEIWSMLAYEDATLSVDQATAWNRTYDLLASHAQNLQTLRDNLAERWPPERNEAAAVFLEYLDNLIDSVHPASFASSSNAVVLSDLLDTLEGAKEKLAPLHDQWQAAAASGTPDPKLQADLNTQAATIMSSTDVAVYQHGQRFVVPPEYEPPVPQYETWTPFQPQPGPSAQPIRWPIKTGTHDVQSERRADQTPSEPGDRGRRSSTGSIDLASTTSNTPTLSGRRQIARTPDPKRVAPRTPSLITTPSGRALRPGGIIGDDVPPKSLRTNMKSFGSGIGHGAQDAPETRANQPQNHEGSASRAGASSGEVARESRAGYSGFGGLPGGAASSSSRRRDRQDDHYVDWPVTTGVPPVLEHNPKFDNHEPGPGVIGIDR
ncbi:MAG TPA: hypothetical protein VJT31_01700 [Rugosimonospora sp.]|nr:hypothetical protein [Rugosimonospora sp.]